MTIKTVLSLVSLFTASGITVHHVATDREDRPASTTITEEVPVTALDEASFEETLRTHAALTEAIIASAKRQAEEEPPPVNVAQVNPLPEDTTGGFMVEKWQRLKDRAIDARFEFKPQPTGRKSNAGKPRPMYRNTKGRSRYNKYGSQPRKMFQRSKQYDISRKKRRDRDRIGRLRTGISRVRAPRRPYVKRQSTFRNSRWGRHADSRYRYRRHATNLNLHKSRNRQRRR